MLVVDFFPLALCGMRHTNKLSVIAGNSTEHFEYSSSTGVLPRLACLKKLVPAVSMAASYRCEFWENSRSCRLWDRKQSIDVALGGSDRCIKKSSSQLCLGRLTRQRREERRLELNSAVPVAAGRGHWKAADIIAFPALQSDLCCLLRLFLIIESSAYL